MSLIRNTLALGALSAFVAAQGTTSPKLDAPCADVVIFMARGNDAPYHDSRTFPFVEATCGKVTAEGKTCDYIDVQFDATYGANYCNQIDEGAKNGIAEITAFNKKCPCTHIVLNGYSEGSHVTGNILSGGGCNFISTGIDSTSSAGKAIAAVLLWGDVMHTANQPYNVLDGADKQSNARNPESLALLNRYSSVLRSYCAAGDPVCAGGKNVTQHLNYFELYTDDASSWTVGKLDNTAPLCVVPSSTSSSVVASSTAAASSSVESVASSVETPASSVVTPASSVVPASSTTVNGTLSILPIASVDKPVATSAVPIVSSAVVIAPSATAASTSAAAVESSTAASASALMPTMTYPISEVTPSPFPEPIAYDACVVVYDVMYAYV